MYFNNISSALQLGQVDNQIESSHYLNKKNNSRALDFSYLVSKQPSFW